jgi:protocatechuate 3,4-dioxygenase beta subunit
MPFSLGKFGGEALELERPARITIADNNEPGVRLLVRGTIHDLAGKPVPNVKIFLYHTDAAGYYSRPVNNPRQSRLRGTVWTDARGQYTFDTIRPAHYAEMDSPPAMHIHVHLQPPNLPNHWVDSYYFDGDPRLQRAELDRANRLGQFSHVLKLSTGKNGVKVGVRDFRVDPTIASRNKVTDS